MGVDVEKNAQGQWTKAISRNPTKGDARVVTLDPRVSKKYTADVLWEIM
jgi:hypothetical protein